MILAPAKLNNFTTLPANWLTGWIAILEDWSSSPGTEG